MLWTQFTDAVMFLSRLPMPRPAAASGAPSGPEFLRFAPLAGGVVAGIASLTLAAAVALHVSSLAAGALTVAALILATGGLHEDGLADVADGFGGGRTRESKLTIMRDSRIGTYGAAALGLGLMLRCASLGALVDRAGLRVAVEAVVVTASLSRTCMLLPMTVLDPARADGLARMVGRLPAAVFGSAILLCLAVEAAVTVFDPLRMRAFLIATVVSSASALMMAWLARRQINGVTGDVVGATQQVAEIAALISLSATL